MSAPRRDRLEANLAKGRRARWQRYAAVTGSAVALATNASLAGARPFASSPDEPMLRSAVLSMAGRNARLMATAAAMQTAKATQSAPAISPGGVVPLYSTVNTIEPGGWVSIYGSNLAAGTAFWNGDFPTSLGGTSVTINGKSAYLSYVSPSQINLQAPDDSTAGEVTVVVITGNGTATSTVALNPYSPSFILRDSMHVNAIILRSDGSGAYGDGAYDILGPADCFGYPTVGAKPGDLVEIFGVGFGPTNPKVLAGKVFSGAAPITEPFTLYINNTVVTPLFVGMSSAGVYQINLIVPPGLGQGDVPITAWVTGGFSTQPNIFFSLQGGVFAGCINTGDGGDGGGTGDGAGAGDGMGDGAGDGGDGGDGGGGGDGGDGGDGDGL